MREYETIFILDPSVEDARVDSEIEKIQEFIRARNGEVTETQRWGRRKLAYEINHRKEGVYTLIRFRSGAEVPAELDRRYRLNESMLRHLTVLHEAPPPGEPGPGREGAPSDDEGEDEE